MSLERAMATAKVGQKGQIVIPKEIRDMFDIQSGDTVIIFADIKQGIALVKNSELYDSIFKKESENK